MDGLLRYDESVDVTSLQDLIEDLCSWISGLRSSGYTVDLLQEKHRMTNAREAGICAKLIKAHVDAALGMLDQAYSGPPAVAFLPLYYAMLSLCKVYVIAGGRRRDLASKTHRRHGASYPLEHNSSRELMSEQIQLHPQGVFSLFYETLTGAKLSGRAIKMRRIYPYIRDISHEYCHCYRALPGLRWCTLDVRNTESSKASLRLSLLAHGRDDALTRDSRYLKILRGRWQASERQVVIEVTRTNQDPASVLLARVRRFLMYDYSDVEHQRAFFGTPVCNSRLLLPEEVPIWLAFYHLSNVVRYNPEFLARLQDSSCWPMLLCLRKHAGLRFLVLFWSYMQKCSYVIGP